MKKLLILCVAFSGMAAAQSTTIYSGTIKDLSQALVTSGQVTFTLRPGLDTTISGVARFVPTTVTCTINASGAVKALDGIADCKVTMNTALSPSGTSYQVCIQPYFVSPGSCFNDYAITSGPKDISTVVPTPTTSPAFTFVDTFSNQSIAGNKTFTGAVALSGSVTAPLNVPLRSRNCAAVDGLVVNDGTDQSAHFQACRDNAIANNQAILELPCGAFTINTSFNCTNSNSLKIKGCGAHNNGAGSDTNTNTTQINCNTGSRPCMDFSGSSWTELENIGFNALQTFSSPSQTILAYSRNNSGGGGATNPFCYSQFNSLRHANINTDSHAAYNGGAGYVGLYDVGAEIISISDSNIVTDTPLWASQANDLTLTGYQTIQTGCPASMSGFNSFNTWYTFSQPSVLKDAFGFAFVNGGAVPGFSTTASVFNIKGTSSKDLFIRNFGVEPLAGTGAAGTGGDFLINVTTIENWDVSMNSQSSTGSSAMIQLAGAGETWKSNRIRINTSGGVAQKLIGNTGGNSHTFKGGEIDFFNSASPANGLTGITLSGTVIKAPGFTDANVGAFNAASTYLSQTDSGDIFHGGLLADFFSDSAANPATTGTLRCVNNSNCVEGRNQANNADISAVAIGGDSVVHIGGFGTSQITAFGGPVEQSEGSAPGAIALAAICYADSTAHALMCAYNNGSFFRQTQTIGSGTATMTTALIGAGACGTTVTVAATGATTADSITWSFNSVPAANPAELPVSSWPTVNNVNFQYCNGTAAGVTPGAATLNWRVTR